MSPPLPKGLLLAGGRSRRMQRDKAMLRYDGSFQIQRAYELLERFCESIYLSLRKGQSLSQGSLNIPILEDAYHDIGPLGGILTAMSLYPSAPWLVVACDLPLLTNTSVSHLLKERDSDCIATAYKSAHDGLPEPLCAVYEPRAREALQHFLLEENLKCPRRILMQTDPKLLDPLEPYALDNVNTPEEYKAAIAKLAATNSQ